MTSPLTTDSIGRTHLCMPRTGPLHINLRAQKLQPATVFNHLTDLHQLLEHEHSPCLIVICDNGPDWSKTSLKTFIVMGRLWRDLNLEFLSVISYAPGDSKYNPIEHARSPVTSWLSQVVTKDVLPGEDTPPFKQPLTPKEIQQKEEHLFRRGADEICANLNGRYFNTHEVHCKYAEGSSLYHDEADVIVLSSAIKKRMHDTPKLRELQNECQLLEMHCTQGMYSIEFFRCNNLQCVYCKNKPKMDEQHH